MINYLHIGIALLVGAGLGCWATLIITRDIIKPRIGFIISERDEARAELELVRKHMND